MNKWKTQTLQTTVLKLLLSSDSFLSKQQHYRFAESEWCCQTLSLSIRMTMITKLLTFITKISNNKKQLYYKTYTSIQSLPNFVPMKWSSNKEMKYSSQQYIIFNKTFVKPYVSRRQSPSSLTEVWPCFMLWYRTKNPLFFSPWNKNQITWISKKTFFTFTPTICYSAHQPDPVHENGQGICLANAVPMLSLIHISEPTRR